MKKISAKTHQQAHDLRHDTTSAEVKLWSHLREHRFNEIHFRRQRPIGIYIVDICAPRKKLIIEIDGSQHLVNEDHDRQRTIYLELRGYKVIRFWNTDVLNNIEEVMMEIERAINDLPPPTSPK